MEILADVTTDITAEAAVEVLAEVITEVTQAQLVVGGYLQVYRAG